MNYSDLRGINPAGRSLSQGGGLGRKPCGTQLRAEWPGLIQLGTTNKEIEMTWQEYQDEERQRMHDMPLSEAVAILDRYAKAVRGEKREGRK